MPARWMILIKNKEWGRKIDWEGMEGRGKEKKEGSFVDWFRGDGKYFR